MTWLMKQLKSVTRLPRWEWLIALALSSSLAPFGSLAAEGNPFEQAAKESYTGRFHGEGVELRLKPEHGKWKGSLLFKNREYTLDAEQNPSGLQGQFADGGQTWPFTALAEGDKLTFNAGSFTAILERRTMPRMEGRWRSPRA